MRARLVIDTVVRDVGNRDVFLFRPGHAVVSEFGVIFIIEEFFFLGDDEQHRRIFDVRGIFDGRELQELFADRCADQFANGDGAWCGERLAVRAPGCFVAVAVRKSMFSGALNCAAGVSVMRAGSRVGCC